MGQGGGAGSAWAIPGLCLGGHSSRSVLTHGTVLPQLQGGSTQPGPTQPGVGSGSCFFVGADEASCAPWLWDLDSGAVVSSLKPHPTPLLQLAATCSAGMGCALAAVSASCLHVYTDSKHQQIAWQEMN